MASAEWALIVAHEADGYRVAPYVTLCPTYDDAMALVRADFAEDTDTELDDDTVLARLASLGVHVWIAQPWRVGHD